MPFALATAAALCTVNLSGEIDSTMITMLHESTCDKPIVNLSSPGGDIEAAFDLLDALRKRHATVIVEGECSSSCAEIILPLYSYISVKPGTMIAVHGNPISKKFLATHYRVPGLRYCDFKQASRMEKEYKAFGRNDRFWVWQLNQLRLVQFRVQSDAKPGTCPSMSMTFTHDGLALKRAQLVEQLDFDPKVDLCGDSLDCVMNFQIRNNLKLRRSDD